jgi:hypothetical protein
MAAILTMVTILHGTAQPLVTNVKENVQPSLAERVKSTLKENGQSIRFLENKGQIDNADVLYYFEGAQEAVYIERHRIRFVAIKDTLVAVSPGNGDQGTNRFIRETHTFSLHLRGGKSEPVIRLGDRFATHYHYCLGEDGLHWVNGVSAAKELTLEDIYPGIDLRLYSTSDGVMEFDWLLDAGADVRQVKMEFSGQDKLSVDEDGKLSVGLHFSKVKFAIADCYQVTRQEKLPVHVSFHQFNQHTVGFSTESKLDPRYPLVIDPTLTWGTFVDANNSTFDAYLFAIQVDPNDGMVYCAGGTNRQFPTGAAPYDADGYLNVIAGLTGAPPSPLPMVTVVYRINSIGSDLVDLTLYGPSTVISPNKIVAQALSLSTNNVFIGGVTNVDIPLSGVPFDDTLNQGDGFVAVFSKDLSSLKYATYLGGTGVEDLGATSIRAINDSSFVVGETVNAALPAGYISPGAADTTFAGTEMYIAKFNNFNGLSWGTYVGGTGNEVFNDLEVLNDGRVAFAGFGTGTLTEVNSAASSSINSDNDGILGVLNSTGTTFNYLDEIGGSGNDRIFDVEVVGDTLYWTGSVSSGFPVSASGVYDVSQNGSTDVVVGKVGVNGGSASYKSTFYGTSSADLGNGIRLVSQTDCNGNQSVFLLVFGTVSGSGLPTLNINGEPFYKATYTSGGNSGTDMFFAAFNSSLSTLKFATYMGGNQDDYLGATGDPRGANHLWVNNADVFLGTTTHSATHLPTLVSSGFDTSKSNSTNDSHIVLSISFQTLFESDFSDAPATYGAPAHILDCQALRIGPLLDLETGPFPGPAANGDDLNAMDDEDGVLVLPAFSSGGPQTISVVVSNLENSTGAAANLYGWIDFNGNGQFSSGEFASTTLSNGFTGPKTLTWTGVTVSGSASAHYLRTRLTTNTLIDNVGTSTVDERSTIPASNGEVEDYRAIELTCPVATTEASCQTQAVIDSKYAIWLATVKAGGGCDGVLSNNSSGAPSSCGGAVTVTFTFTSSCAPLTTTCSSTFTVAADTPPVIANCAVPRNIEGCNTSVITSPAYSSTPASSSETVFENAINLGSVSDVCGITIVTYIDVATGVCPIIVTRTWTVSDACGHTASCNQIITIDGSNNPAITTCAILRNIEGCNTSAITGPSFSTTTTTSTEAIFENATNQGNASDLCGITSVTYIDIASGTCPVVVTRTWTLTNACGNSASCNQIINVDDNTNPAINTCPIPRNIQGCGISAISDPVFSSISTVSSETVFEDATNQGSSSDACGIVAVNYIDAALGTCPIVVTRIWTLTDACGNSSSCSQAININDTTAPVLNCPSNLTIACSANTAPSSTGSALASDNCDPAPVVTSSDTTVGGACPQSYILSRTWVAADNCGNSSSCVQMITVVDNTPPVLVCPANVSLTCAENSLPANTGNATAMDNCDSSPILTFTDITTAVPALQGYIIDRTWTATDHCNNSSTCVQVITVISALNPAIVGDPLDTICSGQSVIFEAVDQGISPITYQWSFGSGSNPSTATGIGPHTITYKYNTTNGTIGAFVILTISTPSCPAVMDTVANVNVNSLPNAAITASPGNPCIFGAKTFHPTAAQVPGFTYLWNFGAGSMPSTANGYGPFTIEYSTAGSKIVKLIVWTNEAGASCADSSTTTFTVNTCPGQITGRVFINTTTSDTVGISGVTVRLFADQNLDGIADNGVIIRNVTTNPLGNYSMASITPGYYVIVELQPSGYFSLWDGDTTEDFDSLSNLIPNDNIIPITVEPGEVDTRNLFAEVISPGIITGYVFNDYNGDQAPQSAEGIPGVTIHLHRDNNADGIPDSAAIVSVATNGIGFYTIGNMDIGNYVLVEQQPSGFDNVLDIDPTNDGDVVPNTNMMNDTLPLTLTNAEVDAENFFIEATPCSQIVTTTEDNVPGCLRFAIQCAGNLDTIYFNSALSNQTLHISAGRIQINKNLYIYSTITPTVMIKSDNSGAFEILAGNMVEFKGVNLTSGLTGFPGAEFDNYGHMILWDTQVFRNPLLPPGDYLIYNHTPGDMTMKGTVQLHDN